MPKSKQIVNLTNTINMLYLRCRSFLQQSSGELMFKTALSYATGTLAIVFFVLMSCDLLIMPVLISVSQQAHYVDWLAITKLVAASTILLVGLALTIAKTINTCTKIIVAR